MCCNTHRTPTVSGRSRRVAYDVDQGHSPTGHSTYLRVSDASLLSAIVVRVPLENQLFFYDTPDTFAARSMVRNSGTCPLKVDNLKLSE
jgi:hypothetical protein